MEIIQLSGYTEQEKLQIAQQYLVPRQVQENGLLPEEVSFADLAILKLINDYTREAGVRGLERQIGKVVRKVATQIVEEETETIQITDETVTEMLKHPKVGYRPEILERTESPGVAVGLAWTPMGGDVLFVEAAHMDGKKGFQYTGQLGDVMQIT